MSNSISHNLFYQSLLHPKVVDHRSKSKASGVVASSSFQSASVSQATLPTLGVTTPSSSFYGGRLKTKKSKVSAGRSRPVAVTPRAVLAMEQPSELAGKFKLDHNAELQVFISNSPTAPVTTVNIQLTYTSDSLILHWGGIHDKREKWVLPARCPDGTKNHKNRALRTPFSKAGSSSFLKLEIDDPKIQAIEFLIFDEAKNQWFKNSGQNFHVKFSPREKFISSNVSVPEELVQVQAYLRWERKGKQMYTPQQEKEEYEAARAELLEEVARGSSVEDLRAKLNSKNDGTSIKESPVSEVKSNIPEDLVQVQSYLRWERAGKPDYSTEQQLREFEEARAELQAELDRGVSLDEIRKKITKGNTHTNAGVNPKKENYVSTERIQRKSRDLTQIVTKYKADSTMEVVPAEPKSPKPVELYANAIEEQAGDTILNKKKFKLGDKEILVLVSKPGEKIKVYVVTDLEESAILHWALAKSPGEWSAPPASVLPPDSVPLKEAAETPLTKPSAELPYQVPQMFDRPIRHT